MVTNAVKKRKIFEKVVLDTSINPLIYEVHLEGKVGL